MQFVKFLINVLIMAMLLPAMVFWTIFFYAGSDLLGFFALMNFFIKKYQAADEAAKIAFCNGLSAVSLGFVLFITLIMFILNLGRGNPDENNK